MEPLSALIIGYGSIGRRHAEIIQSMDMIRNVVIHTKLDWDFVEYMIGKKTNIHD